MTDLVLGIDTGGTYTDGVLLDYHNRQVRATTKTLTTHDDLTRCILSALDALLPDDPSLVKLVSISTTLATNAIAEGKGRPVALFLLGYDPDLVQRFKFEGNFATSRFYYFQGGHRLNGQEQAPLDIEALVEKPVYLKVRSNPSQSLDISVPLTINMRRWHSKPLLKPRATLWCLDTSFPQS